MADSSGLWKYFLGVVFSVTSEAEDEQVTPGDLSFKNSAFCERVLDVTVVLWWGCVHFWHDYRNSKLILSGL